MNPSKKRIVSIDILKVLAVFIVLNSHMDICYGPYSFLATGGAIGDALFFFCSGFMLFRGPDMRLDNFMKRRVARIYPTMFVVASLATLCFGRRDDMVTILLHGGVWFVSCIMIYYVVIWMVKTYLRQYMKWVWAGLVAIIIVSFYVLFDAAPQIYGATYFKWIFFFCFMLQGAIVGGHPERYRCSRRSILKLLGCIVLWYGFLWMTTQSHPFQMLSYLSILPLLGISYYCYEVCCSSMWERLYARRGWGQLIYILGGYH